MVKKVASKVCDENHMGECPEGDLPSGGKRFGEVPHTRVAKSCNMGTMSRRTVVLSALMYVLRVPETAGKPGRI